MGMSTMTAIDARSEMPRSAALGSLLIVDADAAAARQLALALSARGFTVDVAASVAASLAAIRSAPPDYALVDLRLGLESGLEVVRALSAARPDARIVIFSGYGGLAHTVAAIKAGASDHLPKPASVDAVEAALLSRADPLPPPIALPMEPDRVRWEHVQTIFRQSGCNVSVTARTLRMHRRTLQRILARGAPA